MLRDNLLRVRAKKLGYTVVTPTRMCSSEFQYDRSIRELEILRLWLMWLATPGRENFDGRAYDLGEIATEYDKRWERVTPYSPAQEATSKEIEIIVDPFLERAIQRATDRNTRIGSRVVIDGKHGRVVGETKDETFVEFDGGGHIKALPRELKNG